MKKEEKNKTSPEKLEEQTIGLEEAQQEHLRLWLEEIGWSEPSTSFEDYRSEHFEKRRSK